MISIVIPTYNEENFIEKTLIRLSALKKEADFEIIVTDGKSTDRTTTLAGTYSKVVTADKGKGRQLNAGANHATGDILFFVHADMYLPGGALNKIEQVINIDGYDGGGFVNEFSSHNRKIKRLSCLLSTLLINRSSRNKNIFYGDNGIFVRKDVFHSLGGFKEIPIMEDYDFSFRLKSSYKVYEIIRPPLIVDPRRLLKDGCAKTIMKWILIKKFYLMGVPPHKLTAWYKDTR